MRSDTTWITRLEPNDPVEGPLRGWTLAVKDNIDVAGVPTTAACPSYAYMPERSAAVVDALSGAGAVVTGKTNMDQFATGLTGARSPHGPCRSALDPERISGGSSSGSAVAVATGEATIALGTDTAGSGRVPAACNGIVGLKPAPGLWSIDGIVPACRSVDCPSVFTTTVAQARTVLEVLSPSLPRSTITSPRVGIASVEGLPCADAYERTVRSFETTLVDMAPFFETGDLLYEGGWLAERYAAVGAFLEAHPDEVHPVVSSIILRGRDIPAWQAWNNRYRLDALWSEVTKRLAGIDVLVLPTVADVPLLADVLADPVGTNVALGRWTTFVNLLGLCAVSVPGAARADGVPSGVSVIARGGDEHLALDVAERIEKSSVGIDIVVVGAHLHGQPLNHELTSRRARLVARTTTAPSYRLFALDTQPPKPGLVRDHASGAAIDVEVWSLPVDGFGSFVAGVPAPLAIGKVELADGSWRSGFVCEPLAIQGAEEITSFGGWRAYLGHHSSTR